VTSETVRDWCRNDKVEFYNDTKLTLKGLAKKYKTSYQNVKNIHAEFLQETE